MTWSELLSHLKENKNQRNTVSLKRASPKKLRIVNVQAAYGHFSITKPVSRMIGGAPRGVAGHSDPN